MLVPTEPGLYCEFHPFEVCEVCECGLVAALRTMLSACWVPLVVERSSGIAPRGAGSSKSTLPCNSELDEALRSGAGGSWKALCRY